MRNIWDADAVNDRIFTDVKNADAKMQHPLNYIKFVLIVVQNVNSSVQHASYCDIII